MTIICYKKSYKYFFPDNISAKMSNCLCLNKHMKKNGLFRNLLKLQNSTQKALFEFPGRLFCEAVI